MSVAGDISTGEQTETANAGLVLAVFGLSLLQFGLLPLLMPVGWGAAALLLVAVVVATPLHWGLAHESFHGALSASTGRNRAGGRVLAWFLGMSWDLIRFGHLMHHDANRHPLDRPEVIPKGATPLAAAPGYFGRLIGGHALISVISALGALVPERLTRRIIEQVGQDPDLAKIRAAALRAFTNAERRARIRTDILVIILLFAGAVWLWGAAWPVFAAGMALRWMTLSLLDNAPHYGTALDSGRNARNTTVPAPFRWLVMNQNLHGIHHAQPEIGWRDLPAAFQRLGGRYSGAWAIQVLRQFRGPLREDQLRPLPLD